MRWPFFAPGRPAFSPVAVIPVWNGGDAVLSCLESLFATAGDGLADVVCVDNASRDGSADRIARHFPAVRLLRQPVNLGFAGGINAGIAGRAGDPIVLLNQDCLFEEGWLEAILGALEEVPEAGICGLTLIDAEGRPEHTGAVMERPLATGRHVRETGTGVGRVDYVTGAVFAVRRPAWEEVGPLDDGFHPAYYEDCDYCWRARQRGWESVVALDGRVRHLRSSQEWRRDPLRHTADHHFVRYRFVAKHYAVGELAEFFPAEQARIAEEDSFDQLVGRILGARRARARLAETLASRRRDLDGDTGPVRRRLLADGLHGLVRECFPVARDWLEIRRDLPEGPREEKGWLELLAHRTLLLETLFQYDRS